LAKLAGEAPGVLGNISLRVPNPAQWDLAALCETLPNSTTPPTLLALLQELDGAAFTVSEDISATYFTHSGQVNKSVGT
jgi:hypothetical protein